MDVTRRLLLLTCLVLGLGLYGCSHDGDADSTDNVPVSSDDQVSGDDNVYDSFDQALIDRSNWRDFELTRAVGSLRSVLRRFGSDGSNTLNFADPASVDSIHATVTVEDVLLEDTDTGDDHARARARLTGFWYNDGTPGDGATGDVQAEVAIVDSGANGLEVQYAVWRCDDAACDDRTMGVMGTLGTVELGEAHDLSIAWDGVSELFSFGLDGSVAVFHAGPVFPPIGPAQDTSFKGLDTRVDRLDGADESGYIVAVFRDVMANGMLYDDFAGESLSPSLWRPQDFRREIVDGALDLELANQDGGIVRNNMRFVDPNSITAISADVTVLRMDTQGTTPLVSIAGFWYDSGLPGEGDIGEVWGEFQLRDNGSGLEPRVEVFQCTNANCLEGNLLYEDTTSFGSVEIGETYRLSIVWDGNEFTFSLDDNTVTFDPTGQAPVVGEPESPWKALRLRIFNSDAGSAHIRAKLDNVDVEFVD